MGRITSRRAGLVSCLVLALGLSGCSGQIQLDDLGEAAGGDPEVAAQMVDRWFLLARSGEEDFGWWLLYPQSRSDIIGSIDVYREALAGVDWSGFDYELGGRRLHDGRYMIDVIIPGGAANVPEPIRRWRLIQFVPGLGQLGDTGIVTVRIAPLGDPSDIGILAG